MRPQNQPLDPQNAPTLSPPPNLCAIAYNNRHQDTTAVLYHIYVKSSPQTLYIKININLEKKSYILK